MPVLEEFAFVRAEKALKQSNLCLTLKCQRIGLPGVVVNLCGAGS